MIVISDEDHEIRLEFISKGLPLPTGSPAVTIAKSEFDRLNNVVRHKEKQSQPGESNDRN